MGEEIRPGMMPEPGSGDHRSSLKRSGRNLRLESLFRDRPEAGFRLEEILRDPILVDALHRASEKEPDALARDLAAGFRASFPELGDRTPTSIETIDFRANAPDTGGGSGTTGTARDYLNQRLMALTTIADLAKMRPLPSDLRASFEVEADKLATFLVALDRAEPPTEEKLVA